MEELEIHFDDLVPEAQQNVLDFFGVEEPEEMDFDTEPVFVLEQESQEETEEAEEEGEGKA